MRFDSARRAMRTGAMRDTEVIASLSQANALNIMVSNNKTTTRYPVIVARELGLFDRAGLQVSYLDADTDEAYVDILSRGDADAVMLDAPQTLHAVGKGLPLSVVYESMHRAPEVLAVVRGGPINSLADFAGKVIGLASERDYVTAQVVLDSAGIDIADVGTKVVGDSGPAVAKAFEDDAIQAYAAGINDITVLAGLGFTMHDLTPAELKSNPANNFCVLSDRLDGLRPGLEKFFRVWAMAVRSAKLDPDAITHMCRVAVPEEWQNEDAGHKLMEAAVSLNYPVTERFGDLEADVWRSVQRPCLKLGLIDDERDPATFLDSSLIAAANDFADADIMTALERWKSAKQ